MGAEMAITYPEMLNLDDQLERAEGSGELI
jgi:hypothetical protein